MVYLLQQITTSGQPLRSDHVVMVGVQSRDILAPHFCQVGRTVGFVQSKSAAAIACYHTKGYCARQSITCSIYSVAADILRARLFSLMCDIMEASKAAIFVSPIQPINSLWIPIL